MQIRIIKPTAAQGHASKSVRRQSNVAAVVLSANTHLAWRHIWEDLLQGVVHESGGGECLAATRLARHHDGAVFASHGLLEEGGCRCCTSHTSLQTKNVLLSQKGYLLSCSFKAARSVQKSQKLQGLVALRGRRGVGRAHSCKHSIQICKDWDFI